MPKSLKAILVCILAAASATAIACGPDASSNTATEGASATTFVEATAVPPTQTSSPEPNNTPTVVKLPTPSAAPSVTQLQTQTPIPVTHVITTAVPAGSPTPSPTTTPTATHTQPAPVAPTETPAPTPTPTALPSPTPSYVRPAGYDIFAPGGLRGDCEDNPNPVFSEHITDLALIDPLTPAGTVQGGDLKPHGCLHNKPSPEVPVYAPVDSYLLDFAYYSQDGNAIYQFKFQVSCQVAYYFDHLDSVVNEIQKLMPDTPASNSGGTPVVPPLFFQAGDLIGYTGGTSMSQTWDFGVLNNQVWNELPPADTYNYSPNVEKCRFAVCQYEYFSDDVREQYMAALGAQGCGP